MIVCYSLCHWHASGIDIVQYHMIGFVKGYYGDDPRAEALMQRIIPAHGVIVHGRRAIHMMSREEMLVI